MKATNIKWIPAKKGGFVTAEINGLEYQEWFEGEPTTLIEADTIRNFERNYAGLNKQARIPVKVKQHHSEV